MKVDGLGGKWTVQTPKNGPSWVKVDGSSKVNGSSEQGWHFHWLSRSALNIFVTNINLISDLAL